IDGWTDSLRSSAVLGGADFRHRFGGNRYELVGRVIGSRVTGGLTAIRATSEGPVHYLQRPDAGGPYDSMATSLTGHSEEVTFGKVGGGMIRFETSFQRVSRGFESNDLGYLRRADWQSHATWFSLQWNQPGSFYKRMYWNFNEELQWTTAGMALDRSFNTN